MSFSNSSETAKAKLQRLFTTIFFSATAALVFVHSVTDLGLFDVFLGDLVAPQ